MDLTELDTALRRRLPAHGDQERKRLGKAYVDGVTDHAMARTLGVGPVPSTLSGERADLIAAVSRRLQRILSADEVAALLRITRTAAASVNKTLLAVYDDLPDLAMTSAFAGARRKGRGSKGEVVDGFKVRFASEERMTAAQRELERRGYYYEVGESSRSVHELFIDAALPIDDYVQER